MSTPVPVVAASADRAAAGTVPLMFDVHVVEGEAVVFVLPLLGYPVLIIVETPILRQEPATPRRRTAATVLAIISLVAAAPLLVMAWTLSTFGVLLLGGLVVPAVLTLVRLRQPPPERDSSLTVAAP